MRIDMPVLETERLFIRPLGMDDLEDVHRVLDFAQGTETTRLEERRAWLEWTVRNYAALESLYQPPYGERAMVLKDSGRLVGACGLVPSAGPFGRLPYYQDKVRSEQAALNLPEFGLFWALGEPFRGQGYATDAARRLIGFAFDEMHLLRIVATTEYDNIASQRVMQRLGMRIEHNPLPEPHWFQVVGILENK